ncbi:MAG TPA: hypothetical protein PKE37_01465 [Thiomonas arsenitoxydans]|uniref:hypothetical protein n=1 Tax=Thiomonas TaxID=32012 RepID=UPI00257F90C5|nr:MULTISPECIES: hypothetical protein [Thiomonas]HML80422.1 hypothetical protein [Thiomonas arsenitoxydans]
MNSFFLKAGTLALVASVSLAGCGGGGTTDLAAANNATAGTGTAAIASPQPTITGGSANNAPPEPTPTSTPISFPTSDLTAAGSPAAGLQDYGTALRPFTPLAKPAKGVRFTDPDFPGTKIVRVTDAKADFNSRVALPAYPTTQAWNADETLMILYVSGALSEGGRNGTFALYDGKTYKFLDYLDINPADVEQFYWSTTDPSALFYVDNNQRTGTQQNALTKMTVNYSGGAVTTRTTVLHDFAADFKPGGALHDAVQGAGLITRVSGGSDPFGMSWDNDLIGLGAYLNRNTPRGGAAYAAFTYRISTGQIGKSFIPDDSTVPQALPSGKGTYFYENEQQVQIRDPLTNAVLQTRSFDGSQHGDLLLNAAGEDVVVSVQFDSPFNKAMMTMNLTQGGSPKVLIDHDPVSGSFASGRAFKAPGWVGISMVGCPSGSNGNCNGGQPIAVGSPMTYLDQEILLANVDTGKVYRVAHHRSTGNYFNAPQSNYWAQPNITISPSGTRMLFQSDWGDANPSKPVIDASSIVDTYVIELPSYRGK